MSGKSSFWGLALFGSEGVSITAAGSTVLDTLIRFVFRLLLFLNSDDLDNNLLLQFEFNHDLLFRLYISEVPQSYLDEAFDGLYLFSG